MSERIKLTKAQQKIYDFLSEYIKEHKIPPSIREICTATGLTSTSTIHSHLLNLEKKGYIKRSSSKSRSVRLVDNNYIDDDSMSIVNVPIIGVVTAGAPILAEEHIDDYFPLPIEKTGSGVNFMLRVRGDSMKDAGIFNGDLVLVRKQEVADNGEIVVAMIEDSATVKKIYFEDNAVRLQPCNDAYEPILSPNVTVLGKVIGLYRDLK